MSFGLNYQQKIFVKFRKIFHKFSSSAEPEQGNSQLGLGGHLSISISNFYCGSGRQDHCLFFYCLLDSVTFLFQIRF